MKKYYKIIISIMLLFVLSTTNTLQAYAYTETDVYAATEKEFYQYVNEFMKGDYETLTIYIPKNKYKINEYQQGNCATNTADYVLSPFLFDTVGFHYNHEYFLKYTVNDGPAKAKKLEKKSNQIIKKIIKPNMTDKQKVTAIAKYIVKHCKYDFDGLNEYYYYLENDILSGNETYYKYSYLFSAYGSLIKGKSVCEGFSRAFNLLARKAGIPSIMATNSNHGWNIYKINNKYYEIDTTYHQTKGTLITGKLKCNEKDIYKDLLDRYVVLGMDRIKMEPYIEED